MSEQDEELVPGLSRGAYAVVCHLARALVHDYRPVSNILDGEALAQLRVDKATAAWVTQQLATNPTGLCRRLFEAQVLHESCHIHDFPAWTRPAEDNEVPHAEQRRNSFVIEGGGRKQLVMFANDTTTPFTALYL